MTLEKTLVMHVNGWSLFDKDLFGCAKVEEQLIASFFLRRNWRVFVIDRNDRHPTGLCWDRAFSVADSKIVSLSLCAIKEPVVIFVRSLGSVQAQRHHILEYFRLLHAETRCPIVNHPRAVEKGISKIYMKLLDEAGVPIVPTTFYNKNVTLKRILLDFDPEDGVIIKPTCGECGNLVTRLAEVDDLYLREWEEFSGGWLVQPFIGGIYRGEWSLVFVEEDFIEAVRKLPAKGEYRVNSRWGPTYCRVEPSIEQVRLARDALKAMAVPNYLSRVDLVDDMGQWRVSEVEVVNPGFIYENRVSNMPVSNVLGALEELCVKLIHGRISYA